jgi:Fe-S oxidoreductase
LLIVASANGPMRHAIAGALHLSFHPRQRRFETEAPDAALELVDLQADRLGVQEVSDLDWRRWLALDACVQCGRCETACPAFAAGAPLNPKKLIFDLWSATQGASPSGYAGRHHPGTESRNAAYLPGQRLIGPGALIDSDTIWACTTCRACVEECPMMIEHVDAIVDLRRGETMEQGRAPGRVPETLELLEVTATACGKGKARRLDWAGDLDLPVARENRSVDVLLWLGEGALQPRGQVTLRALVKLLRQADVDFAVLGNEEPDCGDLARRLGDEYLFQNLARHTISELARYRFNCILTCDPHVLHCLRNEYPALGAAYHVVHHTTFIDALATQKRLSFRTDLAQTYTYHDPCYLGRYTGEFDAPRRLLGSLASEVREMDRSRSR